MKQGTTPMRLEQRPADICLRPRILWPTARNSGATIVFSSVLVMIAGASPLTVFWLVYSKGRRASQFALLETLTRATPLIFTGPRRGSRLPGETLEHRRRGTTLYLGAVMTVVIGTGAVTRCRRQV